MVTLDKEFQEVIVSIDEDPTDIIEIYFDDEKSKQLSEAKKEALIRYLNSERGQAALARYRAKMEVREKLQAYAAKYNGSVAGIISRAKYEDSEKARDRWVRFHLSEKGQEARQKEYAKRREMTAYYNSIAEALKYNMCFCSLSLNVCDNKTHKVLIEMVRISENFGKK